MVVERGRRGRGEEKKRKEKQSKGPQCNPRDELWADTLRLMLRAGQKYRVSPATVTVSELGVTSYTKDGTITSCTTPPPGRQILTDSREHCLLLHHQPRMSLAKNIFRSVTVAGKQNICNKLFLPLGS